MKKVALFAAVLLMAATSFAETVYIPVRDIPKTLPVNRLVQYQDSHIADLLSEGLFKVGEGFQVVPLLADSVIWTVPGRTLRVHLKEAKFSNGFPVTSMEVVASLERCIRDTDTTLSLTLQDIEGYSDFKSGKSKSISGIRVLPGELIEISTARPAPLLLDELTENNCHVLKPDPKHGVDLLHGAIGAGPYVVSKIGKSELELKKRVDYHTSHEGPDKVIFRSVKDPTDFQSVEDWATVVVTTNGPENSEKFNEVEYFELGTYQLVFNNSRAPFDRKEVRRAVSQAIDYELLAQEMGWRKDRLQAGMVPYGMRGFKLRKQDEDRKAARKLLISLGYTEKKPLQFSIIQAYSPKASIEQKVWGEMFKGFPIRVTIQILPIDEVLKRRKSGDYEGYRVIKYPGSVDPYRLLLSYVSGSEWNTARSRETKCDALIKEAVGATELESRYALYDKADKCLIDAAILAPLSSIQPETVFLRKPWSLKRSNRYLLKPERLTEWYRNDLH